MRSRPRFPLTRKKSTQLRFDVGKSSTWPADVRERLIRMAGRRITENGVSIIKTRQFCTQKRNRQAAIDRLVDLVRRAAERPKQRRKTGTTLASKRQRLKAKRPSAGTERMRRSMLSPQE
ncbi:MAG: aminoacyl-tRNA hydrolase [Thermodesulfobacteriota bacterium]|nr:aminoacyl-tRNA hydrolase [Thermodesulfobacteriota bacterium]